LAFKRSTQGCLCRRQIALVRANTANLKQHFRLSGHNTQNALVEAKGRRGITRLLQAERLFVEPGISAWRREHHVMPTG
jgi:hypothetical protein